MPQKYSTDKNINDLVLSKLKEGWQVRRGKKHDCLIAPNNHRMAIPSSPSDRRAYLNFSRDVRCLYTEPLNTTTSTPKQSQ